MTGLLSARSQGTQEDINDCIFNNEERFDDFDIEMIRKSLVSKKNKIKTKVQDCDMVESLGEKAFYVSVNVNEMGCEFEKLKPQKGSSYKCNSF
jgi:hypothetical protein